ncbi:dTDP-4-dehydrorhamnose reductase [Qiania dongpingensis]|uniref:dTDP-4-dehydrorhamnose reductase n=1 Tax=Qiania dongpingensis TaxID=2763669 RepID=A0A7G9G592_9FIRM|nr:dTDP-4-dehydrorhamnose reductase [Qiania dongpingensis]QNM05974.1 dTDP-4-dehydrorhamnose reductase [Qiania dongpingensis]
MKVLVTGATGQLGHDIMKELKKQKIEAKGIGSADCDITDLKEVEKTVRAEKPDAVIHCAGYTAVDKAETEADKCSAINVDGTRNIVSVCKKENLKLMYVSTDYVFEGGGTSPWKTDDERCPVSVYGRSKYLGELEVEKALSRYFIVRISWIYGMNGRNFIKAILKLAETSPEIKVVSDQIGTPTYTVDIAKTMAEIIRTEKYGIYHVANEGYCSWYEFACEVFKQLGKEIKVVPVTSEEYGAKAKRPLNSRLDKSKLSENGFERLPSWEDALKRFLKEYNEA